MKRGSRLDELLTLLFMIMAVSAIVCYFAVDNKAVYLITGGVAVFVRIVQYVLRFF